MKGSWEKDSALCILVTSLGGVCKEKRERTIEVEVRGAAGAAGATDAAVVGVGSFRRIVPVAGSIQTGYIGSGVAWEAEGCAKVRALWRGGNGLPGALRRPTQSSMLKGGHPLSDVVYTAVVWRNPCFDVQGQIRRCDWLKNAHTLHIQNGHIQKSEYRYPHQS